MTDNKPTVQQKERRLRSRRQIPKSLDAKVTVWTCQGAEDGQGGPGLGIQGPVEPGESLSE